MPVMLCSDGVKPDPWIGYATYLNSVGSVSSARVELMTAWPDPNSVLDAVEIPALDLWRRSINETRSPSLPNGAWLFKLAASDYPPLLAECGDAPACLFGRGEFDCFNHPAIAIVGSRQPSLDGLRLAERFAFELAEAGFVIVSGLAQGVDTAAHRGALAAGGKTIAVMATGIDAVYPHANRGLSAEILKSGALLSEFPPGSAPKRHHFRRRNRTISGLSIATVVIEAGVPSGTLITATAAAEQGRDVYALPWSINHRQGEGCLKLLLEGALLATHPRDVVEGSRWSRPISEVAVGEKRLAGPGIAGAEEQEVQLDSQRRQRPSQKSICHTYLPTSEGSNNPTGCLSTDCLKSAQDLSDEQKDLVRWMGDGCHSAESLAAMSGSNIRDIHRTLTALELLGVLVRHRDGYRKR